MYHNLIKTGLILLFIFSFIASSKIVKDGPDPRAIDFEKLDQLVNAEDEFQFSFFIDASFKLDIVGVGKYGIVPYILNSGLTELPENPKFSKVFIIDDSFTVKRLEWTNIDNPYAQYDVDRIASFVRAFKQKDLSPIPLNTVFVEYNLDGRVTEAKQYVQKQNSGEFWFDVEIQKKTSSSERAKTRAFDDCDGFMVDWYMVTYDGITGAIIGEAYLYSSCEGGYPTLPSFIGGSSCTSCVPADIVTVKNCTSRLYITSHGINGGNNLAPGLSTSGPDIYGLASREIKLRKVWNHQTNRFVEASPECSEEFYTENIGGNYLTVSNLHAMKWDGPETARHNWSAHLDCSFGASYDGLGANIPCNSQKGWFKNLNHIDLLICSCD